METLHKEKRHGLEIEIWADQDSPNPNDWGDDGQLIVFYHRSFDVRRDNIITREDCVNYFYEKKKIDAERKYHIFPLSALIHSGITLYIGSHDHECDPGGWVSSSCGALLISRDEFRTRGQAQKAADALVMAWNDYLHENVYRYAITDQTGEMIYSCGGFYGDYHESGGALAEARAIIDHMTKAGARYHKGQKNIYDMKHVKSVTAICLLKEGKSAGSIVCNWSDNPAGRVCTAQVMLWDGVISDKIKWRTVKIDGMEPFELPVVMIGKAGGCGYDKRSTAIEAALRAGGILEYLPVQGGLGNERSVFEAAGFTWIDVIG